MEKPGQARFQEGFSLKKASLSKEEASMLVMMSDLAKPLGANFEKSFKSLKNKVLAVDSRSPYFIKIPKTKGYPDNEVPRTIAEAITNNEKVLLKYWKDGKLLDYDASPLKIINFDGFWYLACLNISGNFRTQRLGKFVFCEPTGKFFTPPKTLDKYLKESINVWTDPKRDKRVVLKISGDVAYYFKEKEYFPLQKIIKEHKDGSITIETYVSNYNEIIPTIMQWVPNIFIITPSEVKEESYKILNKIIYNNYITNKLRRAFKWDIFLNF